jgi:hypothetical protein
MRRVAGAPGIAESRPVRHGWLGTGLGGQVRGLRGPFRAIRRSSGHALETDDLQAKRHVKRDPDTTPPLREPSIVRRGSTVRVRQRASRKCLQMGYSTCLACIRLSRAGIRGLSLAFPHPHGCVRPVLACSSPTGRPVTPSVARKIVALGPVHARLLPLRTVFVVAGCGRARAMGSNHRTPRVASSHA